MNRTLVVGLLIGCATTLGLPGLGWRQDPAGGDPAAAARAARLQVAPAVWEQMNALEQAGVAEVDDEDRYRWSRRWLEAARAVKPTAPRPALEQHLQRMETLLTRSELFHERGRGSRLDVARARFYAAEARVWLAETKR